jgi:hypothetical protein
MTKRKITPYVPKPLPESCAWCGEPTGRPIGASIYLGKIGPWCDKCYNTIVAAVRGKEDYD